VALQTAFRMACVDLLVSYSEAAKKLVTSSSFSTPCGRTNVSGPSLLAASGRGPAAVAELVSPP
jgi:hypothetical protein